MKTCSYCRTEKNEREFNKSKQAKSGLHSWCRKCHATVRNNRKTAFKMHYIDYNFGEMKQEAATLCSLKMLPENMTAYTEQVTCKNCLSAIEKARV